MKFQCGKWRANRRLRRSQWHWWFAWYPVKIGRYDCRWLEFIERRRPWNSVWYEWGPMEYRAIKKDVPACCTNTKQTKRNNPPNCS